MIPLRSIILALPLVLVAGCGKPKQAAPAPLPVRVAEVEVADVPLYVDTFGNCVTVASVTIVPQVTGILAETKFTEGANVKSGDVIFEIDPRPYEAALQQAKGDLEAAKAALYNAQQNLARQKDLYETKVTDIQDFQNAQAAEQGAAGEVMAGEAAVQSAQINLGYCSIQSPIDGKTGAYLINTGNLVTANSSQLVNIQTISPIYVDYTVSEADLGRLRKWIDEDGLDVEIRTPGDAGVREMGSMHFVDNQIDSGTGTLMMRATLSNKDERLWPGQFVNVRVILTTLKDATLIPEDALLVSQTGNYVYVLKADNTVEMRVVTRGEKEGDRVIVESGLAAGEKVVTSGQIALASGEKVSPQSPPAAASATPSPTPGPVK